MNPLNSPRFSAYFTTALLGGFASTGLLAQDSIPAFPGADGAGALATGGRGGIVYHVTSLQGEINTSRESSPGTLAYGLRDSNFTETVEINGQMVQVVQPRTIVFDVGGTIWLGRKGQNVGWDTQDPISMGSNITIAGETAPGGIIIAGGGLKVNGDNVIIRNILIAPGYGGRRYNSLTGYPDSYSYDAMNISAHNVMIDHVTTVFATDETISVDERADDVTIQFSSISQAMNYPQADAEASSVHYTGHALGSLIQPGSNANVSVLSNLYAHQKGRLPRVGTEASALTEKGVGSFNDFRNNVFYNWFSTAGTGAGGQASQNNFIGNFYLAGSGGYDPSGGDATTPPTTPFKAGGTSVFSGGDSNLTRVYHEGNFKDTNKDGHADDGIALTNSDFGSSNFQSAPYAQTPFYGETLAAEAAFARVLDYVGANWANRYEIDARLVEETRTGTGNIILIADPNNGTEWNNLLALRSAKDYKGAGATGAYARSAGFDTDADGMPDDWEIHLGLDPLTPDNNGDYDNDGYTNLEEYLHGLAAFPAPSPLVFQANEGRYADWANWPAGWQPTALDAVELRSGSFTVDARGQFAGTLRIGTEADATAEFTDGWLEVSEGVILGATGATGTLHLSSGGLILDAGTIAKDPDAVGGKLWLDGGLLDLQGNSIDDSVEVQLDSGTLRNFAPESYFDAWTKTAAGDFTLEGSFTLDGAVSFANGILTVNADFDAASLTLDKSDGTVALRGNGTVHAPTAIQSSHVPGAPGGVQTFADDLTYADSSVLIIPILADSTDAAAFGAISAQNVILGNNVQLYPVLEEAGSIVNLTSAFWTDFHQWPVLSSTSINGAFTLHNGTLDPQAEASIDYGDFALETAGNTLLLHWVPRYGSWARFHFGSEAETAGIGTAASDPDGDGSSNEQEFIAGTNPQDAADVFHSSPRALPASDAPYVFEFHGKAGRAYVLERSTTLGASDWTEVDRSAMLAADADLTLSDTAPALSGVFYRTRIETP